MPRFAFDCIPMPTVYYAFDTDVQHVKPSVQVLQESVLFVLQGHLVLGDENNPLTESVGVIWNARNQNAGKRV